MTYYNGYTTSKKILKMKDEIRKLKIDVDRLMLIALDYSDEIYDVNKKLPKPIEHIFTACKHMNERINELGLNIKRERNIISDNNPSLNRKKRHEKTNVEKIADAVTHKFDLQKLNRLNHNSNIILTAGWNSITFTSIKDIYDRPQHTTFAFKDDIYLNKCKVNIDNMRQLGFEQFADFISDNINDIQVDTETHQLFMIISTKEIANQFMIKLNFNN